ncbi:MAG: hypothetical protein OHK0013_22390 [Sandaracinaceae bacterium]
MTEPSTEEPLRARADPLWPELRAHDARGPLGALCLDVLSRQAEGRTLFVGRELVKKRAEALGVVREAAATSLCNVLDLLERGAESERERTLVCALAVLGLEDAVAAAGGTGARTIVAKAVRHASWLELATDFAWLQALAEHAEGPTADLLADELAQRLLDGSVGAGRRARVAHPGQARATAALWMGALASSRSPRAAERMAELTTCDVLEPWTRAMAGSLAPAAPSGPEASSLEGPAAPAERTVVRTVLAWVTGWAVLGALGRGVAALLGRTSRVSVTIRGRELIVNEDAGLLGRSTVARETALPLSALVSASREARHPTWPLYAGAVGLAGGILSGGYLLFDGVRSGELVLASLGAALVIGGTLCDASAELLSRRPTRPVVELVLPRGRAVRLRAPSVSRADAFLELLRARAR